MTRNHARTALVSLLLSTNIAVAKLADRDLDGMAIIGSQELPKALYIVPWREAELHETDHRFASVLADDPLQPLDRRVFQRELHYHQTLSRSVGAER